MNCAWIMLAGLLVLAGSGSTQTEDPVESITVSPDGTYRPGFMYWYTPAGLFLHPSDFVLLGVVSNLAPPPDPASGLGRQFWSGQLDVKSVVACRADLLESASGIRTLECAGFDGLTVGDTVLAFMVPYEGAYAVPCRLSTSSLLGCNLTAHRASELFASQTFLELLSRGDAWDLGTLTAEELRLWAQVDPRGVAEALIRERGQSTKEAR